MRAVRVKSAAGTQAKPPMRIRVLRVTWMEPGGGEEGKYYCSSLVQGVYGLGGRSVGPKAHRLCFRKWVRVMSTDNGGIYLRLRRKEAKRVAS